MSVILNLTSSFRSRRQSWSRTTPYCTATTHLSIATSHSWSTTR